MYSTHGSCHGYVCMIVGFTSAYDSCHGNDCMLVGCTSRYGGFRGHDYNGSIIVIFNLLGFFWIKVVMLFYWLSDYAFWGWIMKTFGYSKYPYCIVWSLALFCLCFAVLLLLLFCQSRLSFDICSLPLSLFYLPKSMNLSRRTCN
jgi:hypothetical protein